MVTILILLVILLALLIAALRLSKFLFSPQVCYIGGFLAQALLCLIYAEMWGTVLSARTIFIIGGGAFWFLFVCQTVSKRRMHRYHEQLSFHIAIEKWKLYLFLAFQIITFIMLLQFYRTSFGGGSLGDALYRYRSIIQGNIEENITLPTIVGIFRGASCAIGYLLSYVLVYNFINKRRKHMWLYVANVAFSLINEGMLGARGGIVTFVFGMLMEAAIIVLKEYNKKVDFKQVIRIILLGIGALFAFQIIGALMGRPEIDSFSYSLAVYLGAPLHNFNSYLSNIKCSKETKFSTLYTLLIDLESVLHIDLDSQNQYLKIGWNYANGHSMGNVYTTYAPYYTDGGLGGIFIYVTLTAVICQLIYENALTRRRNDSKCINMYVVLYAYVVGSIFMSFFSNMIIPKIFSYYTIKLFAIMYIIKFFIEKMHFEVNRFNCRQK